MQLKRYLALLLFGLYSASAWGQAGTGSVQGKVVDALKPKEGIPFANVIIEKDGVQKGGTTTDIDGKYKFGALTPGKYDIKVSYVGYNSEVVRGLVITADRSQFLDIKMSSGVNLGEINVVDYEVPLISKDETSTGGTVTREEIAALPTRDVNSIAATTAGVFQADEGGALNIRGSRSSSTEYFIDGIRVRGSTNLPNAAIEQTTVITGGIPAQYGDATGGIINITTRGPSSTYFGGAEVLSSAKILEPYGYNLFALNFSGPLITKQVDAKTKKSILGFFLSGEAETQVDASPSAIGLYTMRPDKLSALQADPYRPSIFGTGIQRNSEFVTEDQYELIRVRPNANRNRVSVAGKVDFQPNTSISMTVGGNYDRTWGKAYTRAYSMMNPDNMGNNENQTIRGYARFRQNFASADQKQDGLIRNAYYQVQFDYTKATGSTNGGEALGRNPFNYGYVGRFRYDLTPQFGTESVPFLIAGDTVEFELTSLQGYRESNLVYDKTWALGIDPLLANWGIDFFNTIGGSTNADGFLTATNVGINGLSDVRLNGGLTNGLRPGTAYGIWNESGRQIGGYSFNDNDAYRMTLFSSADIGGHSLKFGFEYDQRIDRSYNMNPFASTIGLWGQARALTNQHILDFDKPWNPIVDVDSFGFPLSDTVLWNRLIASNQSMFDKNLRASLGRGASDFIQIDDLNPDQLKLSYFSADELLNAGNSFVGYFGYDYLGNKLSNQPGRLDFFTDSLNRPIAAFAPVYAAGYIEDKFDFDDLVFRVGLRVDRFDANQPVLQDPFLLYTAKTINDLEADPNTAGLSHPSVVPGSAVVYINDNNASNKAILGYRDGNRWYNAQGAEIRNASGIAAASATGTVIPWLKDPNQIAVRADAFTDYTPQVNWMPRVAFSFPISDEAQFFAHYDVLTQRPSAFSRFDPRQYYFLRQVGGTINNPNLQPERTIDYQLGFKQRLNKTSALTIAAFYRELRNMIQIINVPFAFPADYQTYGNIDFGTVKGLTLTYDLRRTGNVRLNASYTLQFADGTGSAPDQAANIIQAGIDNLRTPIPLSFDARHRLVANLDFRFGTGKTYDGPRIGGFGLLEGVGFNFVANAISGTPYSRQTIVTPDGDAAGGLTGRTTLKGGINGSRLPWQFRMNFRVDKDFNFVMGRKADGKPREASVNVYLQIINLFDNRNITGVYQFTGDPSDDGYLTSNLGAQQLASVIDRQAFYDLYRASMADPGNFSLPRRTRLGVRLNF
ncbi:MAG: TonB-dependent receptor domain-containing protein [Bacteroidota bacterium]